MGRRERLKVVKDKIFARIQRLEGDKAYWKSIDGPNFVQPHTFTSGFHHGIINQIDDEITFLHSLLSQYKG